MDKILETREYIDISDYIPTGRNRTITRKELKKTTGLSDRLIRKMISESDKPIINIGDGYFIPDITDELDVDLLRKYIAMENNRIQNLQTKMQKFNDYII